MLMNRRFAASECLRDTLDPSHVLPVLQPCAPVAQRLEQQTHNPKERPTRSCTE
jgi:hypothetical protein